MEVTDKNTFIDFLEKFREDLKQNPENWENKDLNDFLEAMSRYTEGIQGYYDNTNQDIDSDQAVRDPCVGLK